MSNYDERYLGEENEVLDDIINSSTLLLHNDDYHTFDFVVDALMEICKHHAEQAEQCAYITHYKGKCDVKKGKMSVIRPMREDLAKKRLKVTIV